jgi:hypothetical protein
MNGTVFYQPTDQGIGDPMGIAHLRYFGVTYRVPACDHNTIRQLEWERPPAELLEPLQMPDGQRYEPATEGIVERHETLDRDTGDLLVTYRVPCRPM